MTLSYSAKRNLGWIEMHVLMLKVLYLHSQESWSYFLTSEHRKFAFHTKGRRKKSYFKTTTTCLILWVITLELFLLELSLLLNIKQTRSYNKGKNGVVFKIKGIILNN